MEPIQHFPREIAVNRQRHVRLVSRKFRDRLLQEGDREISGQADAQLPLGGSALQLRHGFIIEAQQLPGIDGKGLSLFGQLQLAAFMGDELGAEQILQPLHLQADGGLGAAQRISRAGEAAEVDHAHEGAQEVSRQVDGAQLAILMGLSSL